MPPSPASRLTVQLPLPTDAYPYFAPDSVIANLPSSDMGKDIVHKNSTPTTPNLLSSTSPRAPVLPAPPRRQQRTPPHAIQRATIKKDARAPACSPARFGEREVPRAPLGPPWCHDGRGLSQSWRSLQCGFVSPKGPVSG